MPAKPEYLVLARLALSAVCRLTPFEPEQVADLKLAITEAATYLMGGERRSEARGEDHVTEMHYGFTIEDDRLVLEVRGVEQPTLSEEEQELCRAIIQATVDEDHFEPGMVRLVKSLPADDQ
jgi:hypothetical protein